MVRELARFGGRKVEVDSDCRELEGSVVRLAVVGLPNAHAGPSAASRTRRSWTRERQRSVRVAPSVRPIEAATSWPLKPCAASSSSGPSIGR